MNHIYIVTYELKSPWVRNHDGLYNAIRSFPFWAHYMDSMWLIVSDLGAGEIYNRIAPIHDGVRSDEYILVSRLTSDYAGYLPQEAWDWINTHRNLL